MLNSEKHTSLSVGEYLIKGTGETVILSVLIGADQSLVGMSVSNSKIISMKYGDLRKIALSVYGPVEDNNLSRSILDHFRPSLASKEIVYVDEFNLVVLETICRDGSDSFDLQLILKALKLYHAADIYSCYSINYRLVNGRIRFGGIGRTRQYTHAIGMIKSYYTLTEEQKAAFPEWYASVFPKLIQNNRNDSYKAMIQTYDMSFLIGICESEYIMLFSILEMLIGTGNSEITYQISRGTALLISNSAEEMHIIYRRMKKLYNARSKYVHSGQRIPHECLFELREYVRKVLIKVADLGFHTQDKKFDNLRDDILIGGYHSFVDG